MGNSVLTITHGSGNELSSNTGYGIVYGWIAAEITEETNTTVTVRVKAYTCGTSSSDPWRGPSWSGMNINSGMSWYEANGSYQELQSEDWGFSYDYSTVIDGYWLEKTFNKRSSEYTVNLYFDTDGSLPNLIDWTVCGTLEVGKIISYPVTYNVDGETVKTLSKYHDTPLTLDCVSPSKEGYTFLGWGSWDGTTPPTQASADYDNGKTYTGNAELKLRAVWRKNQYDIKYYANKPSGITALSVQNLPSNALGRDWNTDYTIPAAKPYLLEHKFLGYSTSPTGNVSYQPGTQYKVLQDLNLYARWQSLYTPPTVGNLRVKRVNTSGVEQDDGSRVALSFSWSMCTAKNEDPGKTAAATSPKYQVYYKKTTESGTAQQYFSSAQALPSLSGNITVNLLDVEFTPDDAYVIEVRVSETHRVNNAATTGTASNSVILTKASYIIDIANQGKRLGLGIAAPSEDGMDIAYKTTFLKNSEGDALIHFKASEGDGTAHHIGLGLFENPRFFGIWDYDNNRYLIQFSDKADDPSSLSVELAQPDAWLETFGISDYIVAQGTCDFWTWRMWASGVAECWGSTDTTSVSVSSSWGALYEGPAHSNAFPGNTSESPALAFSVNIDGVTYTKLFKEAPEFCSCSFNPTVSAGISGIEIGGGLTALTTPTVFLLRPTSSTVTGEYSYHAKGRWK